MPLSDEKSHRPATPPRAAGSRQPFAASPSSIGSSGDRPLEPTWVFIRRSGEQHHRMLLTSHNATALILVEMLPVKGSTISRSLQQQGSPTAEQPLLAGSIASYLRQHRLPSMVASPLTDGRHHRPRPVAPPSTYGSIAAAPPSAGSKAPHVRQHCRPRPVAAPPTYGSTASHRR